MFGGVGDLARIIHESFDIMNKRLQEITLAFLQVSTRCAAPCSRLTLSEGLKRPEPKSLDRLGTLRRLEGPHGRMVHDVNRTS
jgi:hypothetical protein